MKNASISPTAGRRVSASGEFSWKGQLLFGGLVLLYVALLLRRIGDTSLGYPDADRILMDGVFFRDFFLDLPLLDLYDYVTAYYGQYPALSIGYRPPLFPAVEGVFNLVFGVNMWSSRLALISLGVVGLIAFYATVRAMFGQAAALGAALLYATSPFVVRLGWYTMGEIPVLSVMLVSVFFYQRYASTGRAWALWGTVFSAVAAMWTKQTALVLVLWFFLHQVTTGSLITQLAQKRVWAALGVSVILLLPLLVITLWLGDQNIAQSIGMLHAGISEAYAASGGVIENLPERLQPERLLLRIRQLYTVHLELPTLVLASVGLLWAVFRRDGRAWFWASLIIAVYLFFTYIKGQNSRYPILWIPAFAVFASLPLAYCASQSRRVLWGYGAALLLAAGWQVWSVYDAEPKFATGYDEAARYVLRHSESPTVFFDGYNNGYFTYFMRALDPDESMYVLRGDKLLSSTSIAGKNRLEVHVEGSQGIRSVLDRFGPQFIVVEDRNTIGIPVHGKLRDMLQGDSGFRLRRSIAVETGSPSTRLPLEGVSLLIYEDMERKEPEDGVLELRLPVVGQTIRVPFRPTGVGQR